MTIESGAASTPPLRKVSAVAEEVRRASGSAEELVRRQHAAIQDPSILGGGRWSDRDGTTRHN